MTTRYVASTGPQTINANDALAAWIYNPADSAADVTITAVEASTDTDINFARIAQIFSNPAETIIPGDGTADVVYGQPDFVTALANHGYTSGTCANPVSAAVDSHSNRYLCDSYNNRILVLNSSGVYQYVLGQANATSTGVNRGLGAGSCTNNSFYQPWQIWIDGSDNLWVADRYNNRVLMFAYQATTASFIIGQADYTHNSAGTLNQPLGVAVDTSNNVFISDVGHANVRRFPSGSGTANLTIDHINASAMVVPDQLFASGTTIWVSDQTLQAVAAYPAGLTVATIVVGTVGTSGVTAQRMIQPSAVAVRGTQVIVADRGNNRLLVWDNPVLTTPVDADHVIGQADFTHGTAAPRSTNATFNGPIGINYSAITSKWIVTGYDDNRFLEGTISGAGAWVATAVYQQNGLYTTRWNNIIDGTTLHTPKQLTVTGTDLYAADKPSNRGLHFTVGTTTADAVYGQNNLNEVYQVTSAGTNPYIGSCDCIIPAPTAGNVLIVDSTYNRALEVDGSNTIVTIYGQATIAGIAANRGGAAANNTLSGPTCAAYDSAGVLWICDTGNNRVLGFAASSTTATHVIGQANYTDTDQNRGDFIAPAANSLWLPQGICIAGNDDIFIADTTNNRVLFYVAGATTATHVYGQTSFTGIDYGCSATLLSGPVAICLGPNGEVLIADQANNRVIGFEGLSTTATILFGQTDYTSSSSGTTAITMSGPSGVACDADWNLFVADSSNNRILQFNGTTQTGTGTVLAPNNLLLGDETPSIASSYSNTDGSVTEPSDANTLFAININSQGNFSRVNTLPILNPGSGLLVYIPAENQGQLAITIGYSQP